MTTYQCPDCGWATAPGDGDPEAFEAAVPRRCPECGAVLEVVGAA